MEVGDKCKIIENTYTGETFEWEGEITKIEEAFVETKHYRNRVTHPQWLDYRRAYLYTWTKHYFHPDELLTNIKI